MRAKKIAITGSISSGKTTVCRFLKELGAYVVSADELVHRQLTPETGAGQKVIELFGDDVVINNAIDRKIIAKKAFNNPLLLQALENLLHPLILDEIDTIYRQHCNETSLFVAEIPLLFEVGGEHTFEATVAVLADGEVCKKRFTTYTKTQNNDYDLRMKRQLHGKDKAKRATYVIENNGTVEQLKESVRKLYAKLMAEPLSYHPLNPNTGV